MQNLLHYTALDAGLALSLLRSCGGAFLATLARWTTGREINNRILITIGFLGLAYLSFLFGNINLSIGRSIVWPTVLSGIAISFDLCCWRLRAWARSSRTRLATPAASSISRATSAGA